MSDGPVSLTLTGEEALVLLAWVARFNETEDSTFEDQSEARVLWSVEAQLERSLASTVASNYDEKLMQARATVRDPELDPE